MIPEVIEISSDESDVILISNESDQFSVYSSDEEAYETASEFSSDESATKINKIKKRPLVNNTTTKPKSKSKGELKSSTKKTDRESSLSLSLSPILNVSSRNASTVLNSKANESLKSISDLKKTEPELSFSLSPSPEPFAPLTSRSKSSKSSSPKSHKNTSFSNAVLDSPVISSNISEPVEAKPTTSEIKISKPTATPELAPALKDNDDFFYNQEMPKFEFSDSEEEQIPLNFAPKKATTKKTAPRKQHSSPFLSDTFLSDGEEKSKDSPLKETRKRPLSSVTTEESTSKPRPRISNVGDENKIPLAPSKTSSFEALHKELLGSEPQDLDPLLMEIYNEVLNNKESVKDEAVEKTQTINADLGKCKIRCNFPKVDGAHESQIPTPKFHVPIEFSIKLSDNFEQMFYFICKNKNLLLKDMVVEFNGLKIYPRTTPNSLGIAKDSSTVFDVYCEKAYSLLCDKRLEEEKKRFVDEPETPCSETEVDNNSVSLTVRFSRNEDEIFRLKKTTILKKIIDSIRKRRNLAPKTKIILEFDGDKLDIEKTVEEVGLEDEDMINLLIV